MLSSNQEFKQFVMQSIQKILLKDMKDIHLSSTFSDLGFNYILLTKLAFDLNEAYSLGIRSATFLEFKNIKEFIEQYEPNSSSTAQTPTRLEGAEEGVAIIGFSARLPGCADLNDFWRLLVEQKDVFGRTPYNRQQYMQSHYGAFMEAVDEFDPAFFNISPSEAKVMDPQQRLLLQEVWRALDMADLNFQSLQGSATGVYVGASTSDYLKLMARRGTDNPHILISTSHSLLANRISYHFDLRGPSEAIDTACSSSLYALDKAVTAIQQGAVDQAIVCGVNLLLDDDLFNAFNQLGLLSPSNRCKPFDSMADGSIRGEGIIAVILRRQSLAEAEHNAIYAKILATGVGHSGQSQILTSPSAKAQQQLYERIYSKVDIHRVSYLEMHATGTPNGDRIEMEGWKNFLGNRNVTLTMGSVKGNIGHLESASGLAGLIKILLMFQAKTLPGQAHLQKINPCLGIGDSGLGSVDNCSPSRARTIFRGLSTESMDPADKPREVEAGMTCQQNLSICQKTTAWPQTTQAYVAALSSFGFAGVNAHAVIEQGSALFENKAFPIPRDPFLRKKIWFEAKQNDLLFIETFSCIDNQLKREVLSGECILFLYSAAFEASGIQLTEQLAGNNRLVSFVFDEAILSRLRDWLQDHPDITRVILYLDVPAFHLDSNVFEDPIWSLVLAVFEALKAFMVDPFFTKYLLLDVYTFCSQNTNRNHPETAMISGLLASLSKEMTHWRIKHMDVDAPLDLSTMESTVYGMHQSIFYHQGRHGIKELSPAICEDEGDFLQHGGTYLILGGMGGIVQDLIHYLIEHVKAKIILVERPVQDEASTTFTPVHEHSFEFIKMDIRDEVQCDLLLKYLSFKYPSMDGVFDLVMKSGEATLKSMTSELFEETIRIKLLSGWFIRRLQQSLDLKSAIIFSSIHSYVSWAGQANYSAASCGLDAYANYLSLIPGLKVKRINWSLSQEIGAADPEFYLKTGRIQGLEPLMPQEAWEAMLSGLNSQYPQFAVQKKARRSSEALPLALEDPLIHSEWEDLLIFSQALGELQHFCFHLVKYKLVTHGLIWSEFGSNFILALTDYTDYFIAFLTQLKEFEKTLPVLMNKNQIKTWDSLLQQRLELSKKYPVILPFLNLLAVCADQLVLILRGKISIQEVLFPYGQDHLVRAIHQGNPLVHYYNQLITLEVEQLVAAGDKTVRILELGAGFGATAAAVLQRCKQGVHYTFTDINPQCVSQAMMKFGPHPAFQAQVMDINQPILNQAVDVIIAVNVLHTADAIHSCLMGIRSLLKAGGLLMMIETTANSLFLTSSFGLFKPWHAFKDDNRIKASPLMTASTWKCILEDLGFEVRLHPTPEGLHQSLILATAPSLVAIDSGMCTRLRLNKEKVIGGADD